MSERNDTETQSYRAEQGKSAAPDQRERMANVPIAPSSAGVIGSAPPSDESTADADRERAAEGERGESREIL
jgi:hypothetical protein